MCEDKNIKQVKSVVLEAYGGYDKIKVSNTFINLYQLSQVYFFSRSFCKLSILIL